MANPLNWTPQTKTATPWTRGTKNATAWTVPIVEYGDLLLETGDYMLQETGYKLILTRLP
jgi:hypothetical protein